MGLRLAKAAIAAACALALVAAAPGLESYQAWAVERAAPVERGRVLGGATAHSPAAPLATLALPASSIAAEASVQSPSAPAAPAVPADTTASASQDESPSSLPADAAKAPSRGRLAAPRDADAASRRWEGWLRERPRGDDSPLAIAATAGTSAGTGLAKASAAVDRPDRREPSAPRDASRAPASSWSWARLALALGTAAFFALHAPQISSNVQALAAGDPHSLTAVPWIPFAIGGLNTLLILFDVAAKPALVPSEIGGRLARLGRSLGHRVDALMQGSAVAMVSVLLATLWVAQLMAVPGSEAQAKLMPTWAFLTMTPVLWGGLWAAFWRAQGRLSPRAWTRVQRGVELLTLGALVHGLWTFATGLLPALLPAAAAVGAGSHAGLEALALHLASLPLLLPALAAIAAGALLLRATAGGPAWQRLVFWLRMGVGFYGLPALATESLLHPENLHRLSLSSQLLGMWGNLFSLPQARLDRNRVWIVNSVYGGLLGSGLVVGLLWWFGLLGGLAFAGILGSASAFAAFTLWRTRPHN